MNSQYTFENVKDVLTKLGIESTEITPECNLQKDLGLDSLDLADLIFRMEIKFNIRISDEDTEDMFTVQDIVKYLNSNSDIKGSSKTGLLNN